MPVVRSDKIIVEHEIASGSGAETDKERCSNSSTNCTTRPAMRGQQGCSTFRQDRPALNLPAAGLARGLSPGLPEHRRYRIEAALKTMPRSFL